MPRSKSFVILSTFGQGRLIEVNAQWICFLDLELGKEGRDVNPEHGGKAVAMMADQVR
jgi:hypothetical protein